MGSSVSTPLRKAVTDALAALPNLADAKVTYTWTSNAEERFQIYTAYGLSTDTPPAGLRAGRNVRQDEGTFRLVIDVELPGADGYEADTKLDEFAVEVEEWLGDHKGGEGLGVTGLNWLRVDGIENRGGPGSGTFVAQRIYTVRYNARIE